MANPTLLVARESFIGQFGGEIVDLKGGDLIEADHPIAKKYPHLFSEPVLRFPMKPHVEQATAAPGEKRDLTFGQRMAAARAGKRGV